MLGCDAVIIAADPVSGDPVQVRFTSGVAAWQPADAVVFNRTRPESGPAASVCCGYLRFFATRATAGQFAAAHPEAGGTILDPRRRAGTRRTDLRRAAGRYPLTCP
jgi:Alkylmercury lyase